MEKNGNIGGKGCVNTKTVSWLTSCPAHDMNFRYNLERATAADVQAAIQKVEAEPGKTKTKLEVLRRALRKKTKEENSQ